jgi:hypothetical protein
MPPVTALQKEIAPVQYSGTGQEGQVAERPAQGLGRQAGEQAQDHDRGPQEQHQDQLQPLT